MRSSRAEFQKLAEQRRDAKTRKNEHVIRQVAQAVVPITAVTRDENWDFFLSLLQEQIEQLEAVVSTLQESAALDPSFEYKDLAARKHAIGTARTQLLTLQQVLALPKEILEKGESAQFALDALGND